MRLRASKYRAKQKIQEMEEDAETVTEEGGRARRRFIRREIEWNPSTAFVLG